MKCMLLAENRQALAERNKALLQSSIECYTLSRTYLVKTGIQNQFPIEQTTSVNQPTGRTTRPGQIVRRRSVDNPPRPTLQQLATSARNSRSPTRSGNLPPPVRNPSRNPPPLPSNRFPSPPPVHNPPVNPPPASTTNPPAQVGNPVPGPSGSQPPAQVGNPVPGPSGSQPPAPAALVQAGAAPAPGSRAWGIHGMWPSLKTYMKHPRQCNLKIPYDPNQVLPIQDALEDRWFSVNGSPMTHQALWRHEWDKHGTCAARSPHMRNVQSYFLKGLELFKQANVQTKLTAANFRAKKEMTNRKR
ncbi:Similar to Ribonuclease Oy (Crassostrea gigas) [Cotesia congregata]|uniref:Similar to Ribonuclease Oy (Crassostrea gigas) n=1 Tax=Cotesia congregata TaxID=51543 RepID=A0A8J2H289_COTCN|nr:Similar to Ribonuclease Oy (Crassostrea gigas) [Cotesia congregata]